MEGKDIGLREWIASRLTVKRWRILIVGLIAVQTVICGIASYYNYDFTSTDKCRDEVLAEVPIYPNAVLLEENDSRSYPERGTLTRVYQTEESLEAAITFYEQNGTCVGEGERVCSGRPEDNNRIYYEVTFRPTESTNSFSMYIGWSCREK